MAEGLNFPENRKIVIDKILTDIKTELPSSNPNLRNNFLYAFASSMGGAHFDNYTQLQTLLDIFFVSTTFGVYLETKAGTYGIIRLPATKASGLVNFIGTNGTSVPAGTAFKDSQGLQYTTDSIGTISLQTINVSSLTRSGSTVTVTTSSDHGYGTGQTITIAGANETDYNGSFVIIATDTDEFTYTISTTPTTPATGTITASSTFATIEATADDFGEDYNLDTGNTVTLSTPILNVDNTAFVSFNGIGGGADIETDEELRNRLLFRIQNPIALFNANAIEQQARTIAFVDRVFVFEITPAIGQVTVYFTKKGTDIIPNTTEVAEVKAAIAEIKPVGTADADLIVDAPIAQSVDFTFTTLSQNTSGMQQAIEAELQNFFDTSVSVGEDILEEAYISTIYQSRGLNTGTGVASFTLSTPTGDINVLSGRIPILGTVTFP